MNWQHLKNNECPNCGSKLKHGLVNVECAGGCDFFCSVVKFDSIVNNLYKGRSFEIADEEEKNLSALSDL